MYYEKVNKSRYKGNLIVNRLKGRVMTHNAKLMQRQNTKFTYGNTTLTNT